MFLQEGENSSCQIYPFVKPKEVSAAEVVVLVAFLISHSFPGNMDPYFVPLKKSRIGP